MLQSFQHQEQEIELHWKDIYRALFWEVGTGKSRVAIRTVERQFKHGMIQAAFVICEKDLLLNWRDIELPKHSELPYSVTVWDNKKEIHNGPGSLPYFIINPDAIMSDRFPPIFRDFIGQYPKFNFTVDESDVFKNRQAARTKRAIQIARLSTMRRIMTGTPAEESPMELYSQTEILKECALGFKNYYAMQATYAKIVRINMGPRSFNKIVGYKNLDDLKENLNRFSSIIKKKDVLDLPPVMFRKVPVPLTSEQKFHYDELKNRALTYINGNEITVVNALGLINRLLQICAGQIKLADGTYVSITTNRLEVLKTLVNEVHGKTIIWSAFVQAGENIHKFLGDSSVHVHNDLSTEGKQEALETFRGNESVKSIIRNPASGGRGVTLIESHNVIYHDRLYSGRHRVQSLGRTDRIGQTESTLVTDLYAPDTMEEKVIDILTAKRELADELLTSNYLKEILS